ncbi:MAG TPA: V-type ATP synthase subunit I [Rhabdochlamydiaceae bacterium]|nr:V-type ATP synthase subunit I [Rhabdochlamydiaceae bacterium]
MIEDVVKYFIMGTQESTDQFFEKAQDQGFLEFISVAPKKPMEAPVTVQNLIAAHKILRKQPVREPYQGGGDLHLAMQVSERIIELKEDLEKLSEEKRVLDTEIVRVIPFGDFSMEDIAYIEKETGRKVQFFCMKAAKSHKTSFPDEILYIGTEYDLDYFMTISAEPIALPSMIEMRIDSPVGQLESRLDFVEDSIQRFETELKEYAGYINFLHDILLEELNQYHLSAAKKEVSHPLNNSLFVIEAWVPRNLVHRLFGLIDGLNIHAEQVSIDPEDRVPTCLQNEGSALIGEDIIKFYDIPAASDKDPSKWVLWFFAFFFAVIVGDAGYGVIFLGLALFLNKKFPQIHGKPKRFLKLLFILSYACIAWGVITSSYFGMKLPPSNPLVKISPLYYMAQKKADYHLAAKDDVYHAWATKYPEIETAQTGKEMLQVVEVKNGKETYPIIAEFSGNIVFEFIIIIGVVHISLAFLRYMARNYAGFGWIAFLIGGYLFFPTMLHDISIVQFMGWVSIPTAKALGLQLLYGGIGFAVFAALIQKGWKGLNEIANVVSVFSDVLSYLRLYALSLAGAIMAETFNNEGAGLGLFIGFMIILIGHLVNIGLSFMGGVIHGLRLNFLEWYHYCFNGGGRLFKPLQKLKR